MKWLLAAVVCAIAWSPLDGCARVDLRRGIEYRLIKSGARSAMAIATRRRVADLGKCRDFAESKHALAFNYANASLRCIEDVGLFLFVNERQNFTNAQASCQKIHGFLADVTSEARTRGLGRLIGDFTVFVGLKNDGPERIWKNQHGDALSCFEYRAWGTGEPSHSRGCVALFQVGHKTDPIWRVVPCSSELPFICELSRSHNKTRKYKIPFLS